MYIVELIYPGTRIDHPDRSWSWKVLTQLRMLETPLAEAALALMWFEDGEGDRRTIPLVDTENESQRVVEINNEILSELHLDPSSMNVEEHIGLKANARIQRKRASGASGTLPEIYSHHIPFVHAKTFLYSLDRIDKYLKVLKKTLENEHDISDIYDLFITSVPNLRGVRNSVAHSDQRSEGLDRNRRPIQPKPVTNSLINSSGGVLAQECLIGTKFGSTMENGNYGEVDVTSQTLYASGAAIQNIINLLKWKGHPSRWP